MSLADVLAAIQSNPDAEDVGFTRRSAILPEAAIERLREAAARYAAGNPFKAGDVVTPRADATMRGAGEPHLVIDCSSLGRATQGDVSPGSNAYGANFDMRVLAVKHDRIAAFWVESWQFEPYRPA